MPGNRSTPGAEPRDLAGQTALVIGTGPIGQEIGRLCRAFGLRTIGIRRDAAAPASPPGFDAVAGFAALPDRCRAPTGWCSPAR